MKHSFVVSRDRPLCNRPVALAIGNFDGVHLGHRMLIDFLSDAATPRGLPAALMTFEPHPLSVIRQTAVQRLAGRVDKIRLLRQNGKLSAVYMCRFNRALADTSAEDFAASLFDILQARYVAVGANFRFGKQRQGDIALLTAAAKQRGAECAAAPMLTDDNGVISSGRIRRHIQNGELDAAADLLGRPWWLCGHVKHGRGFGKHLGFATANIHLNYLPAASGIFAAAVMIGDADNHAHPAALSIGINPTVNSGNQLHAEAHLLNTDGDLYGKRLYVRPLAKLRDEIKYRNTLELRDAIADDVEQVRAMHKQNPQMFSAFRLY